MTTRQMLEIQEMENVITAFNGQPRGEELPQVATSEEIIQFHTETIQ